MNFGDFTDGGRPGASDYIAGYAAGGGANSDRRWLRSNFALPPSDDGLAIGSTSFKWSDLFLASGAVINFNSGDVTLTHASNALAFAGASSGYSFDATVSPSSNDAAALGVSGTAFSDLFLASGGIINFNAGDVTIAHGSNQLAFAGASTGYFFDALISPNANDVAALGTTTLSFSDLFLASGGVINWNAGDVTLTHSANTLAFAGASSGYTFDALATITSTSSAALAVGRQGSTNPVLNVNASAATVVTGLNLTGAASGSRMAVAVTSSGTDEGLSIDAKGAGTIRLGATSTGAVEFSRNAVPTASDGSALGTTSLQWSDLFLASGGVINWNNGETTFTASAASVDISGNNAAGLGLNFTNANGGATGAFIQLIHSSASPAISDVPGQINIVGKDSGGNNTAYGIWATTILDATDTSEDSFMDFSILTAGAAKTLRFISNYIAGTADDTMALGTAGVGWSDLFLSSGGVINWNNGNVTLTHTSGVLTSTGEIITPASSTTRAGLNVPHGSAPSSPVNGDLWSTSTGLFIRINGSTVGPLS